MPDNNVTQRLQLLTYAIEKIERHQETFIHAIQDVENFYSRQNQDAFEFNQKQMWINDARTLKHIFRELVTLSTQLKKKISIMLPNFKTSKKDYSQLITTIERIYHYLQSLKSAYKRTTSELEFFRERNETEVNLLLNNLSSAFYEFYTSLEGILSSLLGSDGSLTKSSSNRIIKVNETEFHLLCSICGRIATSILIGIPKFDSKPQLLYKGITHATAYPLKHADAIFGLLEQETLQELHHYFIEVLKHVEGIDSYCPQCRSIYCSLHYKTEEIWDEGFYDYTIGRCPQNHERIIDD